MKLIPHSQNSTQFSTKNPTTIHFAKGRKTETDRQGSVNEIENTSHNEMGDGDMS